MSFPKSFALWFFPPWHWRLAQRRASDSPRRSDAEQAMTAQYIHDTTMVTYPATTSPWHVSGQVRLHANKGDAHLLVRFLLTGLIGRVMHLSSKIEYMSSSQRASHTQNHLQLLSESKNIRMWKIDATRFPIHPVTENSTGVSQYTDLLLLLLFILLVHFLSNLTVYYSYYSGKEVGCFPALWSWVWCCLSLMLYCWFYFILWYRYGYFVSGYSVRALFRMFCFTCSLIPPSVSPLCRYYFLVTSACY